MDRRKELEQLNQLRAEGLLSDDEFRAQKSRLHEASAVNWWERLNRVEVVIVAVVLLLLVLSMI